MKVLVACFSLTGNTAQVADAIGEEVSARGHDLDLEQVAAVSASDLDAYDLVFLGSACHDADLARPVKRLLGEMGQSPQFALAGFFTHATQMAEDGGRAPELYERWAGNCIRSFHAASEAKQIAFLGCYHCQGAPSPPIEAFIHSTILTEDDVWQAYLAEVRQHPNREDLQGTRAFARQVLLRC